MAFVTVMPRSPHNGVGYANIQQQLEQWTTRAMQKVEFRKIKKMEEKGKR